MLNICVDTDYEAGITAKDIPQGSLVRCVAFPEYKHHVGSVFFRIYEKIVLLSSGDTWGATSNNYPPNARFQVLKPGTRVIITVVS